MLGTTRTGTGEWRTTWVAVEPKRRPLNPPAPRAPTTSISACDAAAIEALRGLPAQRVELDVEVVGQPRRGAVVLEVGDDRLLELREGRDVAADHRVGPGRGREVPHPDDVERHAEALRELARAAYDGARRA